MALLVIAAALLEAAVRIGMVSPTIVSPPSAIAGGFADLARNGMLVVPTLTTFGETAAVTLIAIALGIPAGVALARSRTFGAAYQPWLGGLIAAPLVLLYPIFLVIFHRTTAMIVVMGSVTAVLPVIIQTRTGMLLVPTVFKAVGRSFNISRRDAFAKIEFPAALPAIATGIRLAIIYGLVSTIGLEYLIDYGGLGRIISDLYAQYDIAQMYAAIVTIVVVSFASLWVLDRIERRLIPA